MDLRFFVVFFIRKGVTSIMKELDLEIGNIGDLIKRFSIPCVISMVVAVQ